MGTTKMGYEAILYYGTAGSQASTQVTNCVDLNVDYSVERGDTTTRGTGATPPINTSRVTGLSCTITWTMLNKTGDATLTALRAAHETGAAVALYVKDNSSGSGPDGDFTLSMTQGSPLKGEATWEFTAEPTDDEGRSPDIKV